MRRIKHVLWVSVAALCFAGMPTVGRPLVARAEPAGAPSLIISQLKITSSSGQFITLYNATDATLDMGTYQLQYFNSYDLTKATSSRLIALSGTVPPHSYYVVSDDSLTLCYQAVVDSAALGLSSTAGLVQVLGFGQQGPGSAVVPILEDYVAWSKTPANGVVTLPPNQAASLLRQPRDDSHNPSPPTAGGGSWQTVQPDPSNACNLVTVLTSGSSGNVASSGLLLPADQPPVTFMTVSGDPADPAGLPPADIGLMAPQITELLPNPSGTGNDTTDEFIELYNPNPVPFDLSNFALQTGKTTLHTYVFPEGTQMPPGAFTAFFSELTSLSLSNSGGQARLLNPSGESLSAADEYTAAKDGQSWAFANGKWYWTTSVTPGAANIIKQPVSSSKKGSKKTAAGTTKSGSGKVGESTPAARPGAGSEPDSRAPIHAWTLALVAALALLYGAYEYRADLARRLRQLRGYLSARRRYRAPA